MAKESEKVMSEEQKQIKVLQEQIRNIRQKGKFMFSYMNLRIKSNDIRKSDMPEIDKKKALLKVCEDMIKELSTSLKTK